uniref:Uncharacterized protein n=1 Tax=Anguilla anguilla TaxID=7936 RepID=A0A0E9UN93_ANGAN
MHCFAQFWHHSHTYLLMKTCYMKEEYFLKRRLEHNRIFLNTLHFQKYGH